ncbi:MAG: copper amine oxidase N-terminal domain-containing protein [Clostridia bacterium]|nr:copper amine oxidase N-terminal domain-containing protein [Clostridia bacterium]MBQ2669683.1 copper amine oxidase N-terminal domain-containing protein [Clostridia bacterium]
MKNLRKTLAALIAVTMVMAVVAVPAIAETTGDLTYTPPAGYTLGTEDGAALYEYGGYDILVYNVSVSYSSVRDQSEADWNNYYRSMYEDMDYSVVSGNVSFTNIGGYEYLEDSYVLQYGGKTWNVLGYSYILNGRWYELFYRSSSFDSEGLQAFYNMVSTASFTPAAQFTSVINPAEVYTQYATNVNSSGVKNGPTNYISWEVKNNDFVAQALTTYHYNYGNGSDYPGTISIYEDGNLLGTWTAQGRENNIYWDIFPEITMRTGHSYRIEDSDYSTWSYNSGSNGEGFFWLYGYDIGSSSTSTTTTVTPSSNDAISIYVDGNRVYPDSDPVIRNDRTLVPIRVVAEALGYQVDWDGANQAVEIHNSEESLYLTIGSSSINHYFYDYFGNVASTESIYSDVAPQIINDRTYLPLRAVGEALGAAVEWDGNTRSVYITSGVGAVG